MALLVERRRFTRQEYHTMIRAGILSEDDPVELLEGEVVHRMPTGSSHAGTVKRMNRLLSRLVGEAAIISVQDPLALGEFSEPEPDLMLLRPRPDFYADAHPTAEAVLLVIEVADTSLATDLEVKVPLYAAHGVREVWLVDLEHRCVLTYRDPAGDRYRDAQVCQPDDFLPIASLPGLQIPASELGL
jgi:Uma2 family endonuclease